jgi:hypothetical protein
MRSVCAASGARQANIVASGAAIITTAPGGEIQQKTTPAGGVLRMHGVASSRYQT